MSEPPEYRHFAHRWVGSAGAADVDVVGLVEQVGAQLAVPHDRCQQLEGLLSDVCVLVRSALRMYVVEPVHQAFGVGGDRHVLFDEPSNHMDLATLALLERFLADEIRCAFVLVSHDRALLDAVTNRTLILRESPLEPVK